LVGVVGNPIASKFKIKNKMPAKKKTKKKAAKKKK